MSKPKKVAKRKPAVGAARKRELYRVMVEGVRAYLAVVHPDANLVVLSDMSSCGGGSDIGIFAEFHAFPDYPYREHDRHSVKHSGECANCVGDRKAVRR